MKNVLNIIIVIAIAAAMIWLLPTLSVIVNFL